MRPSTYRKYLLAVLTVIFTFNFADRFALGLVLENIKIDLHLSDTELGFLSGIAFALFYSVAGIPIAQSIDVDRPGDIRNAEEFLRSAAV